VQWPRIGAVRLGSFTQLMIQWLNVSHGSDRARPDRAYCRAACGAAQTCPDTSQLPIEHWYAWLSDPTVADAIRDRLVHRAYRIALKVESLRRKLMDGISNFDPS